MLASFITAPFRWCINSFSQTGRHWNADFEKIYAVCTIHCIFANPCSMTRLAHLTKLFRSLVLHLLLLFGWEWLLSDLTIGKVTMLLLPAPEPPITPRRFSPLLPISCWWCMAWWALFWNWNCYCCCNYIVSTASPAWPFPVCCFFDFNRFLFPPPLGGCPPFPSLFAFFLVSSYFPLPACSDAYDCLQK